MREEGYYWVFWDTKWEIAYYNPSLKEWKFTDGSRVTNDKSFKKIDENRIINPNAV